MDQKPFGLAVKALVQDDSGRILVLRRSPISKRFAGTWEPPGGKVDAGEAFDVALVREVAEETGLSVALEQVAGATQYDVPAMRLAVLFLQARVVSGEIRLSDEHDDHRWVPLDEITLLELTPKLREFLEEYVKKVLHERGAGGPPPTTFPWKSRITKARAKTRLEASKENTMSSPERVDYAEPA